MHGPGAPLDPPMNVILLCASYFVSNIINFFLLSQMGLLYFLFHRFVASDFTTFGSGHSRKKRGRYKRIYPYYTGSYLQRVTNSAIHKATVQCSAASWSDLRECSSHWSHSQFKRFSRIVPGKVMEQLGTMRPAAL